MVEDHPVASLSSCLPHLFHLSAPPFRGWNPPGELRSQLEQKIEEILGQNVDEKYPQVSGVREGERE